jgi:hypothetical protein
MKKYNFKDGKVTVQYTLPKIKKDEPIEHQMILLVIEPTPRKDNHEPNQKR